ncbi:Cell wall beta-glucan synthesis [Penicillium italicum]|uniref:Cell wall beta-glucan synthesis n=1 Tax=Penicillium italicum TaxID=40296 RepID=A0A0A2L593_PENIT|nr:Cell wall beta-glucan synthesis [Penicillium italicum]
MRYSFTITALSLLSSAFAITVTTPTSDTVWDFSTTKTIKFTSDPSDPPVISIILRLKDGSFQTKLADNVKTSDGEYTTQPNPSISNGDDYEIQIIDSAGELAVSDIFTVKKGASDDGTPSSSSSTTSSSTSSATSSSSSSSSSTTSSSATSTATTSTTSVTSTLTTSASSTPTSSTSPLSSSGMMQLRTMIQGDHTNTPLFIADSTAITTASSSSSTSSTSSSTATSSSSSGTSSTSATASALPSTGAASSQISAPKGAMALLGAALALFHV